MDRKLRASIYEDVKKICSEVESILNIQYEGDAKDLIAELVWKKLSSYGFELESFMKHAKRATVTSEDVKLLVRNNSSLRELVEEKLKNITEERSKVKTEEKPKSKTENSSSASNKRKRKITSNSSKATNSINSLFGAAASSNNEKSNENYVNPNVPSNSNPLDDDDVILID